MILLKPPIFKRLTGVPLETFSAMVAALEKHLSHMGRPPKQCRQDRLLMTLMYWHEYRTQAHTAQTYGLQVVADPKTGRILATAFSTGRTHDFKLFTKSRLAMLPQTQYLADSGYQALKKQHENSHLPDKKSKLCPLTDEQKASNRQLSSERFVIEHIIRSVKIFRIKIFRMLAERYRNWRKRFGLRFNMIASIYNFGRPQ